jgi:hypothetical protein
LTSGPIPGLRVALVVARKTVVRELFPRRARRDEGVKLRLDSGVRVKRAEPDRHFVALGPLRAEEA